MNKLRLKERWELSKGIQCCRVTPEKRWCKNSRHVTGRPGHYLGIRGLVVVGFLKLAVPKSEFFICCPPFYSFATSEEHLQFIHLLFFFTWTYFFSINDLSPS